MDDLYGDVESLNCCNVESLNTQPTIQQLNNQHSTPFNRVSKAFEKAAEWLHRKKAFTPEMLSEPEPLALISATHDVLAEELGRLSPLEGGQGGLKRSIPEEMARALDENIHLFSGFKTWHEMNDASRLLKDDDGGFKPFDRFLQDVKAIDAQYNQNWLYAEYNFATASTQMAAKWADIERDGDEYDLQYRTAMDGLVRPEHAALEGITLPPSDKFWNEYYPPNGWNCRCTAVQVLKDRYPTSDSDQACAAGERATTQIGKNGQNKAAMFRFNPGKAGKVFPPKHPYYKAPAEVKKKVNAIVMTMVVKSQSATERDSYLSQMESLYGKKVIVNGNGHDMKVGFRKYGNKHLYNDTFRSSILTKGDLIDVDQLLASAKFITKAKLYKPRKDDIKRFYYYEAELHGHTVYLQVAEEDFVGKRGRHKHRRYLYSITDQLKQ